jgi:hypothetical protein
MQERWLEPNAEVARRVAAAKATCSCSDGGQGNSLTVDCTSAAVLQPTLSPPKHMTGPPNEFRSAAPGRGSATGTAGTSCSADSPDAKVVPLS